MRPLKVLALALLSLAPARAEAHAMLERAAPAVGSRVRQAPAEVQLWFSEPVEAGRSEVRVLDAAGRQVDRRDLRRDGARGAPLRLSLPPLPPGAYRVLWRACSADGHLTRGDFRFVVQPGR